MKTFLMDGQKVSLTDQQVEIFATLFNARGRVVSTNEIIGRIYTKAEGAEDLVRRQIYSLREKLAPTDFRIINRQWQGYWLSRLPEVIVVEKAA